MSETRGRCLCGQVTYSFEGDPLWQGYCHCESCRRSTASPIAAFLGVRRNSFRWSGALPARYNSSAGVTRSFCPRCGTPMAYESERWPEEVHLYAPTLERPQDYQPAFHVHDAERLPWFDVADSLPRHQRNSR